MKVNIFSSQFLGCQRQALNTHAITIRKPLQLLITLKDLMIAVVFRQYMVAIVDSHDAQIALGSNVGKLELLSFENLRKNYSEYAITVVSEDSQNEQPSFLKDMKGNMYQAKCDRKNHRYYITKLLINPTSFTHSVNERNSKTSNVDDDIILDAPESVDPKSAAPSTDKNIADTDKESITGPTDKENTTSTTGEESTNSTTNKDSTTGPTDKENTTSTTGEESTNSTTNKDSTTSTTDEETITNITEKESITNITDEESITNTTDEESIINTTDKESITSKEDKTTADNSKDIRLRVTYNPESSTYTEKCRAFEETLKNGPTKRLSSNSSERIMIPQSLPHAPTDNNTDSINALKKSPEIFEISNNLKLLDDVPVRIINTLQDDFLDNPISSLGDYRRVSMYYYVAIIRNSSNNDIKLLEKIMEDMKVSFLKSNHISLFNLQILTQNIAGEVIHGYLKHHPNRLKHKLRKAIISTNNEQEKNNNLLFMKMLHVIQVRFNTSCRNQSDIAQRAGDMYTGNPLFRTYQWHYDFAKMSEEFTGIGFEDSQLKKQKKLFIGYKNWEIFENISNDMKKFSVEKFKMETQALTEEITGKDSNKSSSQLSLCMINAKINQLNNEVLSTSSSTTKNLLDRLNTYKKHLILITNSRHIFFCFEQKICPKWDESLLLNQDVWSENEISDGLHLCFKKIRDIDKLIHPIINEAQLDWMIKSHNENKKEVINVCIEGAGLAGLMSSMSQYKVGANVVTIIENRNTDYHQSQIVNLDPKTMSWLKFHMPQGYIELFPQTKQEIDAVSTSKFGIIKSDGFGLISINELENKLHKQITHLSSLSTTLELECLAMTEITDVKIDSSGNCFYLMKPSDFDMNDKSAVKLHKKNNDNNIKSKAFDILICAGGKTSTVNQYLDPFDVTKKQHYGICTWDIAPTENDKIHLFDDFRSVLPLNKLTENKLDEQFNKQLNHEKQKLIFGSDEPLIDLEQEGETLGKMLLSSIKKSLRHPDINRPLDVLHTQLFENNNRICIGMEIPSGYDNWLNVILEKVPEEQQNIATQLLIKCWYQSVASCYGLCNDETAENRMHDIRFPLQQHRVKKSPVLLGNNGTIIAVGDTSCMSHFMTEYGMAAVRASVDHAETLTTKIIKATSDHKTRPEKQQTDIQRAKVAYINDQCCLESEVAESGIRLLGLSHGYQYTDDIDEEIIQTIRKEQLNYDNHQITVNKQTQAKPLKETELYSECNAALSEFEKIKSEIIKNKEHLKQEINVLQETKKAMQHFLLSRHDQIKSDLSRCSGSTATHDYFEEQKNINLIHIENTTFINSISQAEKITDETIESMRTVYVDTMKNDPFFSIENPEKPPSFWDLNNDVELNKQQSLILFDTVRRYISDEQNRIIDKLTQSNGTLVDHNAAQRDFRELKTLTNVFWPSSQNRESLFIHIDLLNKNNEFDDMSNHLFTSRWHREEKKTSIVSTFKEEQGESIFSKIKHLTERVKSLQSTLQVNQKAFELETMLINMDTINNQAKQLAHQANTLLINQHRDHTAIVNQQMIEKLLNRFRLMT